MQVIVRRGFSEGTVDYLPESALQDSLKIKSILSDTLAVRSLSSLSCFSLGDRMTLARRTTC